MLRLILIICLGSISAKAVSIKIAEPAAQPQVAVEPNGNIHIVYGEGDNIFHTTSRDRGATYSPPGIVATVPKLALGMRRGPRISATESILAVSAISFATGNLESWTSSDQGATWKQGVKINNVGKSAREGLHAMSGDGRGLVIAAWLDLRGEGTELWSATSTDGGSTWATNVRVYQSQDGTICECCHPSVALGSTGQIAMMWRNWLGGSRDMYLSMSTDQGKTYTPATKLGTGTWKLQGCPMDGGSITFDHTGKIQSIWRRENSIFASSGSESENLVADKGRHPVLIEDRKATSYLWQTGKGLMIQRGESEPSQLTNNAEYVAGSALPDHGMIVVWESKMADAKTVFAEVVD